MMIARTPAPAYGMTRAIRCEVSFEVIRDDASKAHFSTEVVVSAVHPGPTLLDAARDMLLTSWFFLRFFMPDDAKNVRITKIVGRETI